ncbi:hypothetical protein [Micromonospora yangpuensis]|uniref:Uncharacterized protein n=1 Tax=Micromonospora yangpuensis TaxID=683228 RepID=A0A1C6VH51_9ACTN|nr:hypothetical protein [Micromonospora yangpuensis]GGL99557.1 hypothetical protein GCM10012279_16140 [Micromonospora yangpuensis]SCL65666.1 hypothetical protein GA0070617_5831 [Micromonospora yangpuensis]
MRCVTCGADTDAVLPTCQRCGSALPGAAAVPQVQSPAHPVGPVPPVPPGATEPPVVPSASPGSAVAAPVPWWDLLLCAVLLVAWLLVVLLLAFARGARDLSLVPDRLALWHHLLAALAVAVYLVSAVRGVPETPGHTLARNIRGSGRAGDLARAVRLLLPSLLVTVVVALIAGVTVPLPAKVSGPVVTATPPPAADPVPVDTTPAPAPSAMTASAPETLTGIDDPDARRLAQAVAVDALLSESINSRSDLAVGIAAVGQCRDLERSLGLLEGVTERRRDQRDQAKALDVDALADGSAMRSHLVSAFSYAGDADAAYAAWARRSIRSGCSLDANWRRGNQLSERAQRAKSEFLRRWNPIASSCGLPTRTTKEI